MELNALRQGLEANENPDLLDVLVLLMVYCSYFTQPQAPVASVLPLFFYHPCTNKRYVETSHLILKDLESKKRLF